MLTHKVGWSKFCTSASKEESQDDCMCLKHNPLGASFTLCCQRDSRLAITIHFLSKGCNTQALLQHNYHTLLPRNIHISDECVLFIYTSLVFETTPCI